ncbi:MAG: tRNA-dihydrouridine synthase [Phycisphaeraceae bacterium]|nr:tRNA-dihydrouridine synthase [Phycisphaeraceae bacterium]
MPCTQVKQEAADHTNARTLRFFVTPEPLQIGPLRLSTNLLLAPIAGYCDLAFRTVCREFGGLGLACTDLLSPQGLLRGTATSLDLAKTNDFDKPVGMQLYGSDPEIMAQGARWAVEHGATVVDINMGCPVDKVTKKDGGSKLLTDLSRAVAVAERVRKELDTIPLSAAEWSKRLGDARIAASSLSHSPTSPPRPSAAHRVESLSSPLPVAHSPSPLPVTVPLTCKMRLCWHTSDYESGSACSPHLARMLADVGVSAVTVHGRTTEDKFAGSVRLEGIARVVESVRGAIPVIGNGDVREPEDAARMMRETGCAGVMIGRGALSTPWIFRSAWGVLTTGTAPAAPTEPEIIEMIRRFFTLMREQRDDRYALFQISRRISWFAKRLGMEPGGTRHGVKPFKEAIRLATHPDQVHEALDSYLRGDLRTYFQDAERVQGVEAE